MAYASNSHIEIVQCEHPVKVWLISEEKREARKALHGKFQAGDYIYVGCGHCPICAKKKINDWLFRLKVEERFSRNCFFVTLTYDDEHYPAPKGNGKPQFQKFVKRLRKNYNGFTGRDGFKYYAISETGGKFGRLHIHILMFNVPCNWGQLREYASNTWKNGRIDVERVTKGRIHYVAKAHMQAYNMPHQYVAQGAKNKKHWKKINYYWMACSKGIGLSLLTKDFVDYVFKRGDGVVPVGRDTITGNLILQSLPAYYINRLSLINETLCSIIKKKRLEQAIETTIYTDLIYERQSKTDYHICSVVDYDTGEVCEEKRMYKDPELHKLEQRAKRIVKNYKKYNFLVPPTKEELEQYKRRNMKTRPGPYKE